MKFSLEIGPKTEIDAVPALSDVYITMLPGGDYKETATKAIELVKKGFNPVPHFPARSMQDEKELKDYVDRCKDGGVKQALIIGGGREPAGGINQTIMMALAMVVIASMIGVRGLGVPILQAISNQYLALGMMNGLAIVALAIIFDRVTQQYGQRIQKHRGQLKK